MNPFFRTPEERRRQRQVAYERACERIRRDAAWNAMPENRYLAQLRAWRRQRVRDWVLGALPWVCLLAGTAFFCWSLF